MSVILESGLAAKAIKTGAKADNGMKHIKDVLHWKLEE